MAIYTADNLYRVCSEKHSLAEQRFCSIMDFRETFLINDQKMVINLLNITCTEGNKIRPKELWEAIHKLDDNEVQNCEFLKYLKEFNSLSFLLSIYPHFNFRKSEKPDFILKNEGDLLGLEVISAVSNVEAQVNKVIKFNFGRKKSPEEIKAYTSKNHQNITGKYGFYDVNGQVVLSPSKGLVDCYDYKKVILEKALIKAKKVKSYSSFSEMWVLIDTENNACFTDENDAEELSKLFIGQDKDLTSINKIVVINIINSVVMFCDVETHKYYFTELGRLNK